MLKVTSFKLSEILLLHYPVNQDNRSVFHKIFSKEELLQAGIANEFIEEIIYHTFKKNTLYGVHFQNHPKPQTKLVCCTRGRILDCAVDLRKTSPTYKQWISVELSAGDGKQMYIPSGFGHATLTLEDNTTISMRIDCCFDSLLSRSICYNDPDLCLPFNVSNPVLSDQDFSAPQLVNSDCNL